MQCRLIGMGRDDFSQLRFSLRELPSTHVNVRQPGYRIHRGGIDLECLLVLLLRVGKSVLFFEDYSRAQMRLCVVWL